MYIHVMHTSDFFCLNPVSLLSEELYDSTYLYYGYMKACLFGYTSETTNDGS